QAQVSTHCCAAVAPALRTDVPPPPPGASSRSPPHPTPAARLRASATTPAPRGDRRHLENPLHAAARSPAPARPMNSPIETLLRVNALHAATTTPAGDALATGAADGSSQSATPVAPRRRRSGTLATAWPAR